MEIGALARDVVGGLKARIQQQNEDVGASEVPDVWCWQEAQVEGAAC